jgi:glycosyltransferase involved in cell wall biosynthesis
MALPLSICMIVKNESDILDISLKSIKYLAGEIILVDTGSRDKTREIASAYNARIFNFKWLDDFSAARNESLKYATRDWILVFDADNIFPDGAQRKLEKILKTTQSDLFFIKWLSNTDNGLFEHYMPYLFRNNLNIKFKNRVHETIDNLENLKTEFLPEVAIIHNGYVKEKLNDKLARNKKIIKTSLANDTFAFLMDKYYLESKLLADETVSEQKGAKKAALKSRIFDFNSRLKNYVKNNTGFMLYSSFEAYYQTTFNFFLKANDLKSAILVLEEGLSFFPLSPNLLLNFFNINFIAGKYFECINTVNFIGHLLNNRLEIIKNFLLSAANLTQDYLKYLKTISSYEFGDYQAAMNYLSGIKQQENYPFLESLENIISTPLAEIELLHESLSENPDNPFSYFRVARAYIHSGNNFDRALEYYFYALKLSFKDNDLNMQRFIFSDLILYRQSLNLDTETLEEAIGEGKEISGSFPYYWFCLGNSYFEAGNYELSIKSFKKAEKILNRFNSDITAFTGPLNQNQGMKEPLKDFLELISYNMPDEYLQQRVLDGIKKNK